jgi:nitrogen fixation NifU-like protein
MRDRLDEFVSHLQEQIFEETREAFGDKAYQRWLNPVFRGRLNNPDGYARLKGVCGDTMEIFLKFEEDRVKEASFLTDGCGSSTVCGSVAAELSVGRTPDEILEITGEAIKEKLGRLPKEDEHCAFLAAETVQEALNAYMMKQAQQRDED